MVNGNNNDTILEKAELQKHLEEGFSFILNEYGFFFK
jgi:hypothetical protein